MAVKRSSVSSLCPCRNCPATGKEHLTKLNGVEDVEVGAQNGIVFVHGDADLTSVINCLWVNMQKSAELLEESDTDDEENDEEEEKEEEAQQYSSEEYQDAEYHEWEEEEDHYELQNNEAEGGWQEDETAEAEFEEEEEEKMIIPWPSASSDPSSLLSASPTSTWSSCTSESS